VFHCFGGSKKYLKRILAAGFYVGFDGDVTYVPDRMSVASEVPLDRLLTETDSPWLTPLPHRGERNEPMNVKLIAQAHARVRRVSVEEIERETAANANRLFGW
jgi:TatD DNase family protein